MQNHNEFFPYGGQNAPWWLMPPPPGQVFGYGPGGAMWMPPAPPGAQWQLVPEKKEDKKPEKKEEKKEKQPDIVMKVDMCCEKCVDMVQEEVREVKGVVDVKADRVHSRVMVFGKADKTKVLKRAKRVDKKAEFITETKKTEEKKPEEKKDGAGSSSGCGKLPMHPYYYNYPPYMGPVVPNFAPPRDSDGGPYRPGQNYPPHCYPPQYPESDYGYYGYPYNPHYLNNIQHY